MASASASGDGGGDLQKNNLKAESITLRVTDANGSQLQFKIKKTTSLRKLMTAYCDNQNLSINNVRFHFDGARIQPEDTPEGLGLEENDTIEVFSQQLGGTGSSEWIT